MSFRKSHWNQRAQTKATGSVTKTKKYGHTGRVTARIITTGAAGTLTLDMFLNGDVIFLNLRDSGLVSVSETVHDQNDL